MKSQGQLVRSLGLLDATSIVAGSMIGSGIFIVTSSMAKELGASGYIMLLWLLTGIITIFAALSYGELAGMFPNAGGQYVYIQKAYGKMTSFLYGWTVFTVIQTGVIAAVAVAFAKYSAIFFPFLEKKLFVISSFEITLKQVYAALSIVFLTYLNTKGVKNAKIIQLVFSSTKILAILLLVVFGVLIGLKSDVLANNFHNLWNASKTIIDGNKITTIPLSGFALVLALGSAIIHPLFSSDAWNSVTFISGEIKNPEKNIPRSLVLGTLIVTILYLAANLAYLSLLPLNGNIDGATVNELGIMFAKDEKVGAAAASVIFGTIGVSIMAILIMISTFGCNNGLILSGSRMYYAMAKDKMFFKSAANLNDKGVPSNSLWLQCLWACLLCFSGQFSELIKYSTFASLIFYIITIAGIFILRKKMPTLERPYKAFGYPIVPIFYILIMLFVCGCLMYSDLKSVGSGLLIVLLGIPVYFIQQRIKSKNDNFKIQEDI